MAARVSSKEMGVFSLNIQVSNWITDMHFEFLF